MSLLNCSLLVHTFNKYEKYWDGFLKGHAQNFDQFLPSYFGTDTMFHGEHNFGYFEPIYSGEGEWSDRLIKLLEQIPTDFVWYQQEDMWPTRNPPNIQGLLLTMMHDDIWRLQISPIVHFYSLTGAKIPLFFHYKSKYLVSHQPSIWRKDFLLSCLKPNEDPWKNEYEGTKRLNIPEMTGKIAIYPHDWFSHESTNGKKVV
jgi:hypothetical protein